MVDPPRALETGGSDLKLMGPASDASPSSTSVTGKKRPETLGWCPRCSRETTYNSDAGHTPFRGARMPVVSDPEKSLALSQEIVAFLGKHAIEPAELHTKAQWVLFGGTGGLVCVNRSQGHLF